MGAIARVIQTENGDDNEIIQTVEEHYGENKYCDQYSAGGDDAPPLPEDRVVLVEVEGTGNAVAVGVLSESQGAKPGEKLIYSRDENGKLKSKIWLKNDGSIEIETSGELKITADADLSIDAGNHNVNIKAQKFSVNNGNLEVS